MMGRVYIVGAGPGDPELITVRGLRLLKEADAVVYDRLVPRELVDSLPPQVEKYYVGKAPNRHVLSQPEINALLERLALRGLRVVRLHGGDPLTFGRGEEECLYLKSRMIRCEVVPGVTSFTAAAAAAMAPLAGRGFSSSFAVTTARKAGGALIEAARLQKMARAVDTLVVLMGASALPYVAEALAEIDPQMMMVVVERAYLPGQRITDTTVKDASMLAEVTASPAVIIAGGAALWRSRAWLAVEAGGAGHS